MLIAPLHSHRRPPLLSPCFPVGPHQCSREQFHRLSGAENQVALSTQPTPHAAPQAGSAAPECSLGNMVKPISPENTRISWAWWHVPVVLATREAEVRGSLEPRGDRMSTLSPKKKKKKPHTQYMSRCIPCSGDRSTDLTLGCCNDVRLPQKHVGQVLYFPGPGCAG
uniref:Uncharacterized protein n=1 Tax=Macaca fascicularis TaxID=9541 RepID=Q9BGP4_MACFA|nr:hypothetical protein [Macaca fascicularis]